MALVVYILAHKASLKGRGDAIIEKAELEAENIKQQKIIQAKEKFIQLKSEHEDYISNKNKQLQERENAIQPHQSQGGGRDKVWSHPPTRADLTRRGGAG